jgi:F0F1-type ATP synthase membrane subunit c/vacuolar-type H+-ATPase subunit K
VIELGLLASVIDALAEALALFAIVVALALAARWLMK